MTASSRIAGITLGLAACAATCGAATAAQHCFTGSDLVGWRAADARTLYIRADVDHVYRLDLGRECQTLHVPDAQLIIRQRTGEIVCSAADIDVRASDRMGGPAEPCFVKSITELTPPEVDAIPKKFRP